MYKCKRCEAEFMSPLVEKQRGDVKREKGETALLCPMCGNEEIRKTVPSYCGFCGKRISGGKKYCSDSCKGLYEKYEKRELERKQKIADFDVSRAIIEVDTYNKKHGTDYSYGKYFALKGQGGLVDG